MNPNKKLTDYLIYEVDKQQAALIRRARATETDDEEIDLPIFATVELESVKYSKKLNRITSISYYFEGSDRLKTLEL